MDIQSLGQSQKLFVSSPRVAKIFHIWAAGKIIFITEF